MRMRSWPRAACSAMPGCCRGAGRLQSAGKAVAASAPALPSRPREPMMERSRGMTVAEEQGTFPTPVGAASEHVGQAAPDATSGQALQDTREQLLASREIL